MVTGSPQELLAAIEAPDEEVIFFAGVAEAGTKNYHVLRQWAANYHYFSFHQAPLLGILVSSLDPTDVATLTEVSTALFEEFGSGRVEQVHSNLFVRFCAALGIEEAALPIPPTDVEPEVSAYLNFIEHAYRSEIPGVALGAYCFLERSAVQSYPMMLNAFRQLGFNEEDLIFFSTHVIQEAGHDAGAVRIAERSICSETQLAGFSQGLELGSIAWAKMWRRFNALRLSGGQHVHASTATPDKLPQPRQRYANQTSDVCSNR